MGTKEVCLDNQASPPGGDFKYDFFISHSSVELAAARELNDMLHGQSFKTFIYEDDIIGGSSIFTAVRDAIQQSRRCLFVVSADFLNSQFFHLELNLAVEKENAVGYTCYIPILYKLTMSELPVEFHQLRDRRCLNFMDANLLEQLTKAIQGIANDIERLSCSRNN